MRRLIAALLLLFLLPALACNLPVGPRPGETPRDSARQTLEAQLFPTLSASSTGQPDQTPGAPAAGPETALPPDVVPGLTPRPPEQPGPVEGQPYVYYAQSGDTLAAVAAHFRVEAGQITSTEPIPPTGFIPPGQPLGIPSAPPAAAYPTALLPDSEIVYGPSAAAFDIRGFIAQSGGFLAGYTEPINGETLDAAEIIRRLALETSINPRVLLAVLEYRSGWVTRRDPPSGLDYPIGFNVGDYRGLQKELTLTARQLTLGYYGWRAGTLTDLSFINGSATAVSPQLNAGTVAVQYLFTRLLERPSWEQALYGEQSFTATYARLFGDPWDRAAQVEPLLPAGLAQPPLELPITPGERWSLTGGPHIAWGVGSPRAALDIAPVTGEPSCVVSRAWVLAAAPGVIARAERNQVALDLDGDGSEQTGWVIFYFHVAREDMVAPGTRVEQDARLGHPSCQGGRSTGTHAHIARKYNGEWLPAGDPLPFVLSGWSVNAAARAYEGTLAKDGQIVTAKPDGSHSSTISR